MNPHRTTLGIVIALEMERRWIGSHDDSVFIEVGGMGRSRAEAAAARLLHRGASALVSWGIAGGLDPSLEPGTVVVPEVVIDASGSRPQADVGWRNRLLSRIDREVPTSSGLILHAEEVVRSPADKRELRDRWDAAAVDMESAGVARVAEDAGIPWLVVRAVADAADHELPRPVTKVSDDRGRLRIAAILGLILRPGLWPALIALGRAKATAGRSMRRVWAAAGPDLGLSSRADDR
jgi:adenosylhomocysteine nucleosidase